MATEEELFDAVDALLAGTEPQLPPPAERVRLREAAGVTQARLAQALKSTTQTVQNWENGRSEPRPPRLQAYQRLLDGWAERYPAQDTLAALALPDLIPPRPAPAHWVTPDYLRQPADTLAARAVPNPVPPAAPAPGAAPATSRLEPAAPAAALGSATPVPTPTPTPTAAPAPVQAAPAAAMPAAAARRTSAVKASASTRFTNGPLLVLDGDGTAYGADGLVLECPATTIPQLVQWTLTEASLGTPRLHRNGRDGDPLVVLTAAATEMFGLPLDLAAFDSDRSRRLPEDHKVVKQVLKAKWQLTKRGFGPWVRIYRPADGNTRQCVQLAILPWDALDTRAWGETATLPAPEIARVLSIYATRVTTPRGSTAVSGLELMTALRPPTRAAKDPATSTWVSAPNPGALTAPVDPAPPEATLEHPVAQGWTKGFLDEEAYQWVRPVETLTEQEMLLPWAVGIDINTAFLAAASRLTVGLGAPVHVVRPVFDKKTPGCWYVDLSGIDTDPLLPSPFTPSGQRPAGPAWYATPTVAYAQELGADVQPIEAFLREESGPYLDPWHDRLKEAYVTTLGDAGVPVDKDTEELRFLNAMALHKILRSSGADLAALKGELADAGITELGSDDYVTSASLRHREVAMVLGAIKSTVKGGIGKLRERPQGVRYKEGDRWSALERPTWRPDIRAAVISKARVNMHRKMANTVKANGAYPLAVLSDCVVYPSATPDPLGFLPLTGAGRVLPGSFRIGATPGLAKLEGVQPMLWAVGLMENQPTPLNPARHIKGTDAVLDEGE
ncbi:telomere-associated protein Tap [Streptacidiphilus carbonis]|uniref:telomere-associated protein Tap n=1 Tax=Streptacidiphilus carbonis TaxID=105422 RepID=UPI0005A6282D|nr:helix-turn-helix transcriptional regulator [Streptacidiphilus carbonis]